MRNRWEKPAGGNSRIRRDIITQRRRGFHCANPAVRNEVAAENGRYAEAVNGRAPTGINSVIVPLDGHNIAVGNYHTVVG